MRAGPVGRRYAKALIELATEEGSLDAVRKGLAAVVAAWEASPELRQIFENPAVSPEVRRKIISEIASRSGGQGLLKNTLCLLSDRRRLSYLPGVLEAFETLAEESMGRVRAEVITARPMPESYFAEVQKALEGVTGKQVVLLRREDPSLIAGVVTRIGDKVFDGSVKNQLAELKDEMLSR